MELIFVIVGFLILGAVLMIVAKHLESKKPEETLPFKLKNNFFSQSEFAFYNALLEELDTVRFRVFSKVRIADFVETTATGKDFYYWFNKIKSKHIDFIIWDTRESKIALGVELDGKSHNSQKMNDRDNFVNKLYEQLKFPIKRIGLGKVFADEVKAIKNQIESA